MRTAPIENPEVGMIIANEDPDVRLFATIRKVDDDGFNFWVHNGEWGGRYESGRFLIRETGEWRDCTPFQRVVALDPGEEVTTYLDRAKGHERLVDAGKFTDPDQRLRDTDPDGSGVDRPALALRYVQDNGLVESFDSMVEAHLMGADSMMDPDLDLDLHEEDDGPGF